jgi:hypothetical protein
MFEKIANPGGKKSLSRIPEEFGLPIGPKLS